MVHRSMEACVKGPILVLKTNATSKSNSDNNELDQPTSTIVVLRQAIVHESITTPAFRWKQSVAR